VRIVKIVRMIRMIWTRIWEFEPDRKFEPNEERIRPKRTVLGKEAAINEETIVREEVAVKMIESAVEQFTTIEARTVKSAALKTHITGLGNLSDHRQSFHRPNLRDKRENKLASTPARRNCDFILFLSSSASSNV
jgi:hypothetical protein